jgi:ADP-heptose:LPS heptosyltransferase
LRPGQPRHRALAGWAALAKRRHWAKRSAALRKAGKPVIVIGMVEHLGDIVATEPIARHLRAQHPDGHLVWAVRQPYRELVEHHPDIDEVLTVRCLTEWVHLLSVGGQLFDQVVDLHVPERFCDICNIRLRKDVGGAGIDVTNYYNHGCLLEIACKCGGLPVLTEGPRFSIPSQTVATVDRMRLPGRYVVVHATSNQDVRDWETGKWQRLAERIGQQLELPVVEVGLRPKVSGATAHYVDLCGRLSILETAEVIRRAEVFIGIDSGPAHMANAVGTYGVILLGHYRSYRWYMPYSGAYADGSNAHIIHGDGPAATAIDVETVFEAISARVRSGAKASV